MVEGLAARVSTCVEGPNLDQARPRFDDALASQATACRTSHHIQQILLGFLGRFQEIGTREDFDVAGRAAGGAAGKWNWSQSLIADVEQWPALGCVGLFGTACRGREELDFRHALILATIYGFCEDDFAEQAPRLQP
jgi:hypothetical protein